MPFFDRFYLIYLGTSCQNFKEKYWVEGSGNVFEVVTGTEKNSHRRAVVSSIVSSSEKTSASHLLSFHQATLQHGLWCLWEQKKYYMALHACTNGFGRHEPDPSQNAVEKIGSATPLVRTVAQQPSSVDWEWVFDVFWSLTPQGPTTTETKSWSCVIFRKKRRLFSVCRAYPAQP